LKTLAAVLTKLHAPLELMELELPPLREGEVLVEMKYSGICRSQLNEIKGFKGHDPYLPHTLGHEGSGIVRSIGPGITKVTEGDHVVLTWIKGEGKDATGITYSSGKTIVNSGPISTFINYAIIAENRVVPIPKTTSFKEAALYGCAIPTGSGIVFNELQITPGSSIAIFGLGGIGLSALIAAHQAGASPIIAIDTNEDKFPLAKGFGATHTLLYHPTTLKQSVLEITKGGVDFAIEAAGVKEVMELAFQMVKDKTGLCILAGNVPSGVWIECDPFDFIKGKRLIGTWGGGVKPDRDIPEFLKRYASTSLNLHDLISHEAPLEEINTLISLLDQGKATRALIRF